MTETSMWNDTDRQQGVLTEKEREYLLDRREVDGQAERNMRYRIRQRLLNALLDIQLLINSNRKQTVLDDLEQIANNERVDLDLKISLVQLAYDMVLLDDDIGDVDDEFELVVRKVIERATPYEETSATGGEFLRREIDVVVEVTDEYFSGVDEDLEEAIRSGEASLLDLATVLEHSDLDEGDELYKMAEKQLEEKSRS